ncbi:MAG TPA: ATP synthase F1 subunit gamma [Pyrinomonadaceae bacterium]|nr:ATP synthase F1 subunit gamma [Pyrinomonadaceae bacterium]
MANLLDLRRRIKSVKNTQQITKAMKMLSAVNLRRAQERVTSARPFAGKMTEVLGELAGYTDENYSHPLLDRRGDSRYLLVLITADKGLAGAFNANLIKAAQAFIGEHAGKTVELMAVGRKGRDFYRRRPVEIVQEYVGLTGKGRVSYAEAVELAEDVMKRFREDESLDKVFIIYNEFRSVLQQRVVVEQLLPVARDDEEGERAEGAQTDARIEYLYEQPPAEIFGTLLPRLIETQIFRALLESIASEQGARMTAMDAASKNAGELIGTLTLNMNRIRQAAITKEIIEVVSGAAAAGK